jgi:putative phosphoribosyl transferase
VPGFPYGRAWQASCCRKSDIVEFATTVDYPQPPFQDRRDAGRKLAAALMHLKADEPVVLALPRGGVPVAYEVATALHAPLDVLLVRKIGAPYSSEVGLGAVVEADHPRSVLNQRVIDQLKPPPGHIEAEAKRQIEEIARRRQLYCGNRPRIDVGGRTVIVIDDGVATGSTMKAALQALAEADPERLVFAVPVAPADTLDSLRDDADEGVCLVVPERFRAVSLCYANFEQTSDDEVRALLDASSQAYLPKEKIMRPISEIMTHQVIIVSPKDNVQHAAQMMREWNIGALPVCEGKKLVGMITDRDITIRATATGQPPQQISVADAMTGEAFWCYEDQSVGEILQQMGDRQIRRIPVLDRNHQLIGMVSLGDVAAQHAADVDDTFERISTPCDPIPRGADEVRAHRRAEQTERRV